MIANDKTIFTWLLTKEQAERIAGMIEAISNQISELDRQNHRNLDEAMRFYQFYLTQKHLTDF